MKNQKLEKIFAKHFPDFEVLNLICKVQLDRAIQELKLYYPYLFLTLRETTMILLFIGGFIVENRKLWFSFECNTKMYLFGYGCNVKKKYQNFRGMMGMAFVLLRIHMYFYDLLTSDYLLLGGSCVYSEQFSHDFIIVANFEIEISFAVV